MSAQMCLQRKEAQNLKRKSTNENSIYSRKEKGAGREQILPVRILYTSILSDYFISRALCIVLKFLRLKKITFYRWGSALFTHIFPLANATVTHK